MFCGTAYVVNSKLFEVQDIEIKGNAHMDRDEVLAMLNLEEGDNILGWDMDAARLRLLTHPG